MFGLFIFQMTLKNFYNSGAWKNTANAYKKSRHYICEMCQNQRVTYAATRGKKSKLIVHHKIPITEANFMDKNISQNSSNLQLLCIHCHNAVHSENISTVKGVKFDMNGQLVPEDP